MSPRKLYIDSRAKKAGTHGDFVWQPDRPLMIEKCRGFIESVHIPNVWGTITETNQHMYVTEQLPLLTVLASANRIYLLETSGQTAAYSIVVLASAIYSGASLATEIQTKLNSASQVGATYSVTYTASNSTLGTLQITTNATSFSIASRAELIGLSTWGSTTLSHSALADASDVLGTLTTSVYGAPTATLTLSSGLAYRKLSLTAGTYNFITLASEVQTQLNSGTDLGTNSYTVSTSSLTGKLTIANSNAAQEFKIWPEEYLEKNPYAFQGFTGPFYGADIATGFRGEQPLVGNTIEASGHVNTMRYHSLFINSSLGSHNDSIGPMSQSSIARKIVIDQGPGMMIHDFHSLPYDYLELEQQSISAIRFRLSDWRGYPIAMDTPWSLSIILVPEELF